MLTRGFFWAIMGASGHIAGCGIGVPEAKRTEPLFAVFCCLQHGFARYGRAVWGIERCAGLSPVRQPAQLRPPMIGVMEAVNPLREVSS